MFEDLYRVFPKVGDSDIKRALRYDFFNAICYKGMSTSRQILGSSNVWEAFVCGSHENTCGSHQIPTERLTL